MLLVSVVKFDLSFCEIFELNPLIIKKRHLHQIVTI